MILFFDRSTGTNIPRALREYLKPLGLQVEYHDLHFDADAPDDDWLPIVGERGWIVIGQDHHYHLNSPEVEAISQYSIGAFYLWGATESKWEVMCCFARGYTNILNEATVTPKPFIYRVEKRGNLNEIHVPWPR